jgi:hypothetical protein
MKSFVFHISMLSAILFAVVLHIVPAFAEDAAPASDTGASVAPGKYPLVRTPVPVIQDGRLEIITAAGRGVVPIHVSRDWSTPQPDVTRAVIVIHGWVRRDLTSGERAAIKAGPAAQDAIIITPQFLVAADIKAHQLPADMLHWGTDGWKTGYDAHGPAPISSFSVIDTIFARLADKTLFPALKQVVLAGHSAGGQLVQRYAAVGHGQAPLLARGIAIRYVVANPSSYLYFDTQRPVTTSESSCAKFNRWEYGLSGGLPPYVEQPVSPSELEKRYLASDIVYLFGMDDNDPNHAELDRSCGAEAEGPTRLSRGLNYVAYLRSQDEGHFSQRVLEVPGVGHSSSRMYPSTCGMAALFDREGCDAMRSSQATSGEAASPSSQ